MNLPSDMKCSYLTIWYLTLCVWDANGFTPIKFQTAFEWNYLNFTFPGSTELYKSGFEPGIYTMYGIDVYKPTNSLYLALPRTNRKARITLARLSLSADKRNPLLSPFPNWEMNRGTDCFKLQDVTNMEIDTQGIMWVLDAKRNNREFTTCPARIALFNLKDEGKFFGSFNIPEELCSWESNCVVNDLVLDGDFVYLTYVNDNMPGIMVLNKVTGRFWRVGGSDEWIKETPERRPRRNYFWIALSFPGKNRSLYIAPEAASYFYKIPTKVLQNEKLSSNGHFFIEQDVKKFIGTSAVTGDSEGDVYFGYPRNDSVYVRDAASSQVKLVDRNRDILNHPGTFAFDNSGFLYKVNALTDLFNNNLQLSSQQINFRIVRARTGTKSYQYPNLLKQSPGQRHLHVQDLLREKENYKKHQDELKKHIENQKKLLEQERHRLQEIEKLHKEEQKRERAEEARRRKEEQERRRNEEKHHKEEEKRQREEELRERRERERRDKEEEKRHREELKHQQDEEKRRQREEQQRLKDEEKRQQGELKRQREEEQRKHKEEEQKRKQEQKRLEEDNQRILKHELDNQALKQHPQHHHPAENHDEFSNILDDHHHGIRSHYPQSTEPHTSTRRETRPPYPQTHTVHRTPPHYPTTEYSTSHHTIRRTRPPYPTTEYSTSYHTVRRPPPTYLSTTRYPTSYHTVRRTRPTYSTTTEYFTTPTRKITKPTYPTSYHTVRRTRPTYSTTTEYFTTPTRKITKPTYPPTSTHQQTRPHYTRTTTEYTSHHHETRPSYPRTTEYLTSIHHGTRPHYN